MKPAEMSKRIQEDIIAYLDSALPIKNAMNSNEKEIFKNFQDEGMSFVKPPFLERSQEYKSADSSLGELAKDGKLEKEVAEAFAKYLLDDNEADPYKVYPYEHQKKSLEALSDNKNLVICTGTGSGKTESFLLPILNRIYKEKSENPGKKKVHLLILYPMNALVNDQIRRLRKILKYLPQITFGCYTGDTDKKAMECFLDNTGDLGEQPPTHELDDGDRSFDENALPNEFLNRQRWEGDDGPADILVTNYSMLERLLLLPESKIFASCWDFIVIDEAHSYSGSLGTEISWLMRRLEWRMRPDMSDDTAYAPIQYVAASATLSDDPDPNVRNEIARNFAADLFPIKDKNSIVVEFGTPAKTDERNANSLPGNIWDFFDQNEQLYNDTIRYESERNALKGLSRQVPVIQYVLDHKNKAKAITIWGLASRLSQCQSVVVRNQTIQYWIRFYKECQGVDNDAKKLAKALEIESQPAHALLEEWNKQDNSPLSGDAFSYLYEVVMLFAQEHPEWNLNIPDHQIELTPDAAGILQGLVDDCKPKGDNLKKTREDLDAAWKEALPEQEDNPHYPELLYRSLVCHDIIKKILTGMVKPITYPDLAKQIECTQEQLQKILDLAALAVPVNRRMPLIDVRYHQVIRDICDIGIYFENGDIKKPHFIRTEQEYAATGEKIFTLGLCRNCGQPYLLGYADGNINNIGEHRKIFRSKAGDVKFLQAIAWSCEDLGSFILEDNFPQGPEENVWLNLLNGEVRRENHQPEEGGSWCQVYWLLDSSKQPQEKKSYSFISKCSHCGNTQKNFGSDYGIITPYESVGIQYKIAVLNSFTGLADPESDETKRAALPAGGRKVLSFSDSRSKASTLAYRFENTQERRLLINWIREILNPGADAVDIRRKADAIQQEIDNLEREIKNASGGQKSQLREERNKKESEKDALDAAADQKYYCGVVSSMLQQKAKSEKYLQILEFEDENGKKVPEETVAKILVLKTLRDRARKGLMRQGLVHVCSDSLDNAEINNTKFGKIQLTEEQFREICQAFFEYLVCYCKINFTGMSEKQKDEYEYTELLDGSYTRAGIIEDSPNFKQIIKEHLEKFGIRNAEPDDLNRLQNEIWSFFHNPLHGNKEQNCILPINEKGKFCMDFAFICKHLYLTAGERNTDVSLNEITAFVIEEHTAQIHGNLGAVYQQKFSEGKINILSCSTTFEMGIDVGGLNSVFLGNLPPAPAQYRQRAGRAGRRPGAAAYILSVAGDSAHDRYFYNDLSKLFFGPVQPPAIYRDRPVYGARHMRAESLHSFLKYLNDRDIRDWDMISHFLTGYVISGRKNDRKMIKKDGGSYCRQFLETWKNEKAESFLKDLSKIKDYTDFDNALPGYNAVDDLIFQLLPVPIPGNGDAEEYQKRGGCRLPEKINNQLKESSQYKRKSLEDRLLTRLCNCIGCPLDQLQEHVEDGNERRVQKELFTQTFSVLSDSCILPKYGFPTEVIQLLPAEGDNDGDVTMSRPLQYGLFEYAPDQIVTANKRRYQSKEPVFYLDGENIAGDDFGNHTFYCGSCQKIIDSDEGRDKNCPECGSRLECKTYYKPDAFRAKRSIRTYRPSPSRGVSIVRWGGEICNAIDVPELCMKTEESSTRMMQYINAGLHGNGYRVYGRNGCFFFHEAQTNIAIWEFTGRTPDFLAEVYQSGTRRFDRKLNAHRSAMYALRRSIALILNVAARDIGVYLDYSITHNPRYVFCDTAAGGGCCALSLVMRKENDDTETANRIKAIIDSAIKMLENDQDRLLDETVAQKMPLPVQVLNVMDDNTEEKANYRQAHACYDCLKEFDNQIFHDVLDVSDALAVLKSFRREPDATAGQGGFPVEIGGRRYVAYDSKNGEPDFLRFVMKRDRTCKQYLGDIDLTEIIGIEVEKEN